jgi:hypothetical protein
MYSSLCCEYRYNKKGSSSFKMTKMCMMDTVNIKNDTDTVDIRAFFKLTKHFILRIDKLKILKT